MAELNDRLRSVCYVRRLRHEVLDLTETQRHAVSVSLNGHLDRYRQAENDLITYLRQEKGVEAARSAQNAEVLVQLNTLRQLAGEAKVEAAAEWIATFLEENPERQLVVFAWHETVQRAVAKAVKGAIYLKGEKDIEAAKARFNSGEARVIVCSLQAHREGHTLVAEGRCQDVLFLEQPWHPGAVSQAEDRINRIGRTAEAVFAWTLVAQDASIDQWLAGLIADKWEIFKAAVNGKDVEQQESSIINDIVARYQEKAK